MSILLKDFQSVAAYVIAVLSFLNSIFCVIALYKIQEEETNDGKNDGNNDLAEYFQQLHKEVKNKSKTKAKHWILFQLFCSVIVFGFSLCLSFDQFKVSKNESSTVETVKKASDEYNFKF